MAKGLSFPGTMTDAIILHAPLQLPLSCPSWQEPLLQALPYAHRLELERRNPAARRASLSGLGLVLMAAARLARQEFPSRAFAFPREGKPRLVGGPFFSISHSLSRVACVVCAGTDCGVDIEDVQEPFETAAVTRLQRWTATEAVLKAAGLGLRAASEVVLADSLAHASIGRERYELQAVNVVPGAIGHVAAGTQLTLIVESLGLDDPRMSALLERSFGLATQFE
jgi:phosphopantetheinyl transferase